MSAIKYNKDHMSVYNTDIMNSLRLFIFLVTVYDGSIILYYNDKIIIIILMYLIFIVNVGTQFPFVM